MSNEDHTQVGSPKADLSQVKQHKTVVVVCKEWGPLYFEEDQQLASREQLIIGKWTTEVLPNRAFYILIVKSENAEIHTPMHMVIIQLNNALPTIVDPDVTWQQFLVDIQLKVSVVKTI